MRLRYIPSLPMGVIQKLDNKCLMCGTRIYQGIRCVPCHDKHKLKILQYASLGNVYK